MKSEKKSMNSRPGVKTFSQAAPMFPKLKELQYIPLTGEQDF